MTIQGQAPKRTYQVLSNVNSGAAPANPKTTDAAAADAKRQVRAQFTEKAQDKDGFHALMREVYGNDYDRSAAEDLRQRTLRGDHSWMPEVRVVGDDAFHMGGEGAYADGVVYLKASALQDPKRAASILMEEVGHHIDSFVKDTDTVGDEGEMFRRFMAGEKLSARDKAALRAENDKGTIQVDGKEVEVEFFFKKIGRAIKKGVKAIGRGIKKGAEAVGKAIGGGAKSIGEGIVNVAKGVGQGVVNLGKGIVNGAKGAWEDLKKGRVFNALGSLVGGVVSGVGNAGSSILNGVVRGVQGIVEAPTHLLGKPGRWIRNNVTDRLATAVDRGLQGVFRATTGMVESIVEGVSKVGDGLQSIVTGRPGEGLKRIGSGLVQTVLQTPADAVILGLGSVLSAVQIGLGIESKGRGLTDAEIAHFRTVFGDSIDYSQVRVVDGRAGLFDVNDRAFVHGNTIYMKGKQDPHLLLHEMHHVWQFQNGGPDYITESLWAQREGDKAYDWERSVPGTPWEQLETEQQAQFLQDASEAGAFVPGPGFGAFFADVDGDGVDEDLSAYLQDALAHIREGAGAP